MQAISPCWGRTCCAQPPRPAEAMLCSSLSASQPFHNTHPSKPPMRCQCPPPLRLPFPPCPLPPSRLPSLASKSFSPPHPTAQAATKPATTTTIPAPATANTSSNASAEYCHHSCYKDVNCTHSLEVKKSLLKLSGVPYKIVAEDCNMMGCDAIIRYSFSNSNLWEKYQVWATGRLGLCAQLTKLKEEVAGCFFLNGRAREGQGGGHDVSWEEGPLKVCGRVIEEKLRVLSQARGLYRHRGARTTDSPPGFTPRTASGSGGSWAGGISPDFVPSSVYCMP